MGNIPNKAQILHSITAGAKLYKQHLMGKNFLYVFENQFIEVAYHADEFKHLTGVATNISARSFFKKALDGTLRENQIGFDQNHKLHFCKRKMKHIQSLQYTINSELIVLKTFYTSSEIYQFALTDLNFTLCLGRDLDIKTKVPKNDYYIVKSLRDGDNFNRGLYQYECNYIFSKQNDQPFYDKINYSDGKVDIDSLPIAVRNKIFFHKKGPPNHRRPFSLV